MSQPLIPSLPSLSSIPSQTSIPPNLSIPIPRSNNIPVPTPNPNIGTVSVPRPNIMSIPVPRPNIVPMPISNPIVVSKSITVPIPNSNQRIVSIPNLSINPNMCPIPTCGSRVDPLIPEVNMNQTLGLRIPGIFMGQSFNSNQRLNNEVENMRRIPSRECNPHDIIGLLRDVLEELHYSTNVCECCLWVAHETENWRQCHKCEEYICSNCHGQSANQDDSILCPKCY